jgi:hypothetical protein
VKTLVFTICQGEAYQKIAKVTHPTIKAYAKKIGADFLCISEKKISTTSIHWEKFQVFDLLNTYDRILFLDTDLIIREDCPDLFGFVPEDKLGAFDEAPFTDRSKELIIDTCKAYGVTLPGWNGKYYNTGVMVISKRHKHLFKKPELEYYSFYEQTYLNMRIAEQKIEMFDLEYRFNRMTCMDAYTGEDRHASFIIHYAGCPLEPSLLVDTVIKKDVQKWKKEKVRIYQRHIHISVTGGMGDQLCALPAIEFMKKFVYPKEDITISTHFPRLFKDVGLPVFMQGKFQSAPDTPYYLTNSLPAPDTITWMIVSNLLCHTVDYCSISMLKRTLPMRDREFHLSVSEEELATVKSMVKTDLGKLVVIHPGKHWQSKTLPVEYWQEIIDKLARRHKVCIIGKDDETRGTVKVNCPENAIDLRNILELGELIALLSKARVLISNDSAPVHIAGAFDNWIVLIPTCKHPDHVFPYRKGGVHYKSLALYKSLVADDFVAHPATIGSSSAEFTVKPWEEYLLPAKDVVKTINDKILQVKF